MIRRETRYSVLGPPAQRLAATGDGLAVVVLDRHGRLTRGAALASLQRLTPLRAVETLCFAGEGRTTMYEELSRRHPRVRFVAPSSELSPGEQVNIAAHETRAAQVLVVWSDTVVETLADSLLTPPRRLATVPVMRDAGGRELPTVHVPARVRADIEPLPWTPTAAVSGRGDEAYTLFPFDFVGLYDRNRLRSLGGFDPLLGSPYWQSVDLGLRAYLWGDALVCSGALRVSYQHDVPVYDASRGHDFDRFALRNLAVRCDGERGYLPLPTALRYALHARRGLLGSWPELRAARRWVAANRYRFVADCRGVVDNWPPGEERADG